ncbi:unnamed protein product [Ixodes pacificus]
MLALLRCFIWAVAWTTVRGSEPGKLPGVSSSLSPSVSPRSTPGVTPNVTPPSEDRVPVGQARIRSAAPYLEDGGVNLSCSVAYRDAVHTSWSIDGRPPDDSALESILTGHAGPGLWLRDHRLELRRLDRLPSASGRYQLACMAVADGNLSRASLFVASLFGDACRGDAQCTPRGAQCRGGRCRCTGALKVRLASRHTTCRHAAFLDWPCVYHEQCQIHGSRCGPEGTCVCTEPFVAQGRTCASPPQQQPPLPPRGCQCKICGSSSARPAVQLERQVPASSERSTTQREPLLLLLSVLALRP